jgi:hypothetical protein
LQRETIFANMFTAARNPKRFRTDAVAARIPKQFSRTGGIFTCLRDLPITAALPNRRGLQRETIFANSRDFLRPDAPMHSEEYTDGGVLQLYEDFFGVEEAVGPPARSPFVPNRASCALDVLAEFSGD